jgi:hypothetical protein
VTALGLLIAIPHEHVTALLAREGDDDALAEYIDDVLEPEAPPELVGETDQAWQTIHRCLGDGTLAFGGHGPLARCILGGRLLTSGDGYLVLLTEATDVPDVDRALSDVTHERFAAGYRLIDPLEYGPSYGRDDLAYAWQWFQQARQLWAHAAQAGLAVVFTADQ